MTPCVAGARYKRDTYLGTCDVEPIRGGDEYTAVTADNHITIQNASELFHYEQASIQYAGEVRIVFICNRGIEASITRY